jgi:hypothetical protein
MKQSSSPFQPVRVFYSYSHEDEDLRIELEGHLKSLKRVGLIDDWHDRRIGPGQAWAGAIDENLEKADIILLLVSHSFVASDYCYEVEMMKALERHRNGDAVVVPVILRPVVFEDLPFAGLQALPTDARPVVKWSTRDDGFKNVVEGLRRLVKEISDAKLKTYVASNKAGRLDHERRLDAAISEEIPIGEFRELLAMIRGRVGEGLGAVLREDEATVILGDAATQQRWLMSVRQTLPSRISSIPLETWNR